MKKNNMIIDSAAVQGDAQGSFLTVECVNLAPTATDRSVLAPVGEAVAVAPAGWKPLGRVTSSAGREWLLVTASTTLGVVVDDETVSTLATLPSVARCMAVVDGNVVIMTDSGPFMLIVDDDELVVAGESPVFPVVSFSAQSQGQLTEMAAETSLTSTSPTRSERLALFNDTVNLINKLKADARRAGALIHPVLVAARFVSPSGSVLHESPPVLVCGDESTLGDFIRLYALSDTNAYQPQLVGVDAFRLKVNMSGALAEPWSRLVDRCEILVASPFEVDTSSADRFEVLVRTTTSTRDVLVTLNDMNSLSSARPDASRRSVAEALAAFSRTARVVATLRAPFIDGYSEVLSFDIEASGRGYSVVDDTEPMRYLRAPGVFTADGCATTADSVLWSNPTAMRFGGYDLRAYANELADKSWRAVVAVRFGEDGETVVWQGGGTTGAPVSLSSLLTYPSPDAVSMTVRLSVQGESNRVLTVALAPDSSCRYAMAFNTSIIATPMDDTDDPWVVDAEKRVARTFDGHVVVAGVGAPTSAISSFNAESHVIRLLVARSGTGAWEFRRQRYYAFTDLGVMMAVVNATQTSTSVSVLDRRSPVSGECVADGADAVYFATPLGQILRLAGSTVRPVVNDAFGVTALGYLARRGELIAHIPELSRVNHYILDMSYSRYSTTVTLTDASWHNIIDTTLVADTERGLLDLARRDTTGEVNVTWRAAIINATLSGAIRRYRGAIFYLSAPEMTGEFAISRRFGDRLAIIVSRAITAKRPLSHPLTVPINGRPISTGALSINATLTSRARLIAPRLVE